MPATVPPALAARLLGLLDLTSLGEDDSPAHIEALCASARQGVPPAAVCVYPEHVTTAARALAGSTIGLATVVNFPDGSANVLRVAREIRRAIAAGAHEIDLVLPWAAFRHGDLAAARAVLAAARHACGEAHILKLILETGELGTPALIRAASELGIEMGADFLKTSTGKATVNATPEAAAIMLDAIAAHGGRCGFKAAGGIRTPADAVSYFALARERLGDAWITPTRFRLGASALRDALLPLASA